MPYSDSNHGRKCGRAKTCINRPYYGSAGWNKNRNMVNPRTPLPSGLYESPGGGGRLPSGSSPYHPTRSGLMEPLPVLPLVQRKRLPVQDEPSRHLQHEPLCKTWPTGPPDVPSTVHPPTSDPGEVGGRPRGSTSVGDSTGDTRTHSTRRASCSGPREGQL